MIDTYVLHVTKECNMNCLYCYEQDKTSIYTWEEIKDTIDLIFENLEDEKINIEFLGGEPMLAFDYIKNTYDYIEENYKGRVNGYVITTNGTIVTNDLIGFLKKNQEILFAISMDGNKFANQLRVIKNPYGDYNSYDTVVKNIKKLQENDINNINIHIVTHPYNIAFMSDSIKHLYELGIKSVGIGTIESTMDLTEDYIFRFMEEIKKVSSFVKENSDLQIGLFNGVKPLEDVRTYFKDSTGKTIVENYGRSKNTMETDEVSRMDKQDKTSMIIYKLRKFAYDYHNGLLKEEPIKEEKYNSFNLKNMIKQ